MTADTGLKDKLKYAKQRTRLFNKLVIAKDRIQNLGSK